MQGSDITDPRNPVTTRGAPRPRTIAALTSIRFFAALYVALYHFVNPHTLWGPLTAFFSAGYVGVSFFFVLSGFILTYSHAEEYVLGKGRAVSFLVARAARVYPLYLLSVLAAAYVMRDQFHQRVHLLAYLADLLMVQSWSTRMVSFFNVPGWSLSSEAFFYLCFPFVLLPLRPWSRRGWALTMAGLWLLALALPLACLWLYPAAAWSDVAGQRAPGSDFVFAVRRLPLLALPQFLAGVSLGWFYLRYGISRRASTLLTWLAVLLLCLTLALSNHLPLVLLHNGLLLPAFSMLILGLCRPNVLSRLLESPALVLLGEASYALYLFHYLLNTWLRYQFAVGETVLNSLWKLLLVIPASVLLHLAIERPCRRGILLWWRDRYATATR